MLPQETLKHPRRLQNQFVLLCFAKKQKTNKQKNPKTNTKNRKKKDIKHGSKHEGLPKRSALDDREYENCSERGRHEKTWVG